MAVIKANAYGHGMLKVAECCSEVGADYLGVALLDEALSLKEHGIATPVLILGYTSLDLAEVVVSYGFRQTVYDWDSAQALSDAAKKIGKPAYIHVKVDTGMSRIGFIPDEQAVDTVARIAELPGVILEGVFTHFACADIPDRSYTELQIQRFNDFLKHLKDRGCEVPLRHAANTAAILKYPEAYYDMVRAGIGIYGLKPSSEVDVGPLRLVPAMRLVSKVVMVKDLPAGTPVSYGGTYVTERRIKVATVPVGYGDGYTRAYSNRAWASIRGKKVPLIGRVCMDQCMFDVTEVEDVGVGDEVVLFGGRQDGVTADDLAEWGGTIGYEVICLINSRVPRYYVGSRMKDCR